MCIYRDYAARIVHTHKSMINDEFNRKVFRREIAHYLYDIPLIPTGLVSEKYKDYIIKNLTKEHFHARQKTADLIIRLLDSNKVSIDRLAVILKSRVRVHYVHKSENQALRKVQNLPDYPTWHKQYAAAGIKLVPYVNKRKKRL